MLTGAWLSSGRRGKHGVLVVYGAKVDGGGAGIGGGSLGKTYGRLTIVMVAIGCSIGASHWVGFTRHGQLSAKQHVSRSRGQREALG